MPYSPVRPDEDPDDSFGSNQIVEPLAGNPDSDAGKGEDESMRVPFFLRPTTLFVFSASLMTIGLALGILAWYSVQHRGICAAGDRQYYAWTYGPTAGKYYRLRDFQDAVSHSSSFHSIFSVLESD